MRFYITKTRFSTFSFLIIFLSFLFFGCDVGLGVSSEKKSASINITYPLNNSIIKDNFVVVGSVLDNSDVSSISVVLSSVDSTKTISYGPYSATIDFESKKWNVEIPLLGDGTYLLNATALNDNGDSYILQNSYVIDNTSPLIILTNPTSVGLNTPDEVGINLEFSGMQYDENLSGELTLSFYDTEGVKICDYVTKNSNDSWNIDIEKSDSAYVSLFSNENTTYRFTVSTVDKACLYQDPEGIEIEASGNSSEYYYSWTDIVSLLEKNDETPKLSSLYSFDSGETVASIPAGLSQVTNNKNALQDKRIYSAISKKEDILALASFSIDPNDSQPDISIDNFISGNTSARINSVGAVSSLRVSVKLNGNKDLINTEEMYVTLGTWDGISLDTLNQPVYTFAPKETISEFVMDSELVFEYVVPQEEGQYRLVFDIKDVKGNNARDSIYDFIVYDDYPIVSVLPGKALQTNVFPLVDTYKVELLAESSTSSLTLSVYEKQIEKATGVSIWESLNIDLTDSIKETNVNGSSVLWTLAMPVKENDECTEYKFVVSDGSNKTSLSRFYTMDFDAPQLRQLVSPQIVDGKVNVFSKDIMISGFTDDDVVSVKACVATKGSFNKDLVIWYDLILDSQVQTIKSLENESQIISVKSFSGLAELDFEESIYELWICFNCSEEIEEYTEPVLVGEVIWDNANPVIVESSVGSSDEFVISEEETNNFSFFGTVSDSNGIDKVEVECEYITDESYNTLSKDTVAFTENDWTYTPKFDGSGTYKYIFTVTDKAEKTSSLIRCIYLDKTLPQMTISLVNTINEKYVNGILNIEGTVSDNKGIGSFIYSYANGKEINIDIDNNKWQLKLDTNQIPDNKKIGDYLSFVLADEVGNSANLENVASILNQYVVKQSTDNPEVIFSAPAVIEFPNDISSIRENRNLFKTNDIFSFTVKDDDGISKVEIFITPQGKQTIKKEIVESYLGNECLLSYSFNELLKGKAEEGYYTIQVIAYDSDLLLSTDTGIINIALNNSELSFGEISTSVSDKKYRQEEIDFGCILNSMTINGSFDESQNISSLNLIETRYSLKNTETKNTVLITENSEQSNWNYYIQKADESVYVELQFVAKDIFNRKKTLFVKYFFDYEKPVFEKIYTSLIKNTTNYINASNSIELSGVVTDKTSNIKESGIQSLDYMLIESKLTKASIKDYLIDNEDQWKQVSLSAQKDNWSLSLDLKNNLDEEYYLVLRLSDNNYNENVFYYDIVIDRKSPSIDFRVDYSNGIENNAYIVNDVFELALSSDEENLSSFIYEEIIDGNFSKKDNLSSFYDEYLIIPSMKQDASNKEYKYIITAIDMAGNKTVLTKEILLRK